jgi:hypothetical protein
VPAVPLLLQLFCCQSMLLLLPLLLLLLPLLAHLC